MAEKEVDGKEDVKEEKKEEQVIQFTETEVAAMEMGWKPKDKWDGAEEDWVPAKVFMKFGDIQQELKKAKQEATQKEKVIKAMKEYHLRVKDDAKKEVIDTLKKAKKTAMQNEDFAKVAEIDSQLEELDGKLENKFKQHDADVRKIEADSGPPPEFFEWNRRNPWYQYGSNPDEITKEADVLAYGYAAQHPKAEYKTVLDYVEKKIKQMYPDKFQKARTPSPVDEGGEHQDVGGKKKYRLTAAEKAAADAFGMTHEAYAEGLKKWDAMKGGAQ